MGNVQGDAMRRAAGHGGVSRVREDAWHCLEPAWIEQELAGSLARLRLGCVDCVLLHCPEFASRCPGVGMDEVYRRIRRAFEHLEKEVARGRVARYGISAAFYPLRGSDPEHLVLDRVLEQRPPGTDHFQVLQFPLNFAEPQALWLAHYDRTVSSAARPMVAPAALLEQARQHGLGTLSNRPLDGIFGELRGVLRFSSEVPAGCELGEEDVDALEAKLTALCAPGCADPAEPVTEQLAAKTVKVLACLQGPDCVLVGMRSPRHVVDVVRLLREAPAIDSTVALDAFKSIHNSINMWFCMAQEEDHGTAKDWRLPPRRT